MAGNAALDLALSLARERRAAAEQALAAAQNKARQAAAQNTLLARYRQDYVGRMHAPAQGAGQSIGMLLNSRAFVGRLDVAVQAQQAETVRLEGEADAARQAWADACRHEKSIEILLERRAAAAAQRAARAEQKLADEFAARAIRRAAAA